MKILTYSLFLKNDEYFGLYKIPDQTKWWRPLNSNDDVHSISSEEKIENIEFMRVAPIDVDKFVWNSLQRTIDNIHTVGDNMNIIVMIKEICSHLAAVGIIAKKDLLAGQHNCMYNILVNDYICVKKILNRS